MHIGKYKIFRLLFGRRDLIINLG